MARLLCVLLAALAALAGAVASREGCHAALKDCAACDATGATCTACADGFAMYKGNCYAKCKKAGDVLVPISASFYFKLACIPASALGCAPGSPVADFDGCSACPAKQCLGRLALSDPKLKEVKPLKVWISWEEDAWFDTDPVTCSTACAGCASLGDWSGGSACASCKPTAVSQPHALAPGLFECLDSVTDDLNCAKGGGFKDGTGCTRCDPEYYLDTRKNVTMERSAVAAAAALPLAVCSSCSGDFNCKNCTANGCAACDAPDSWNSDGAFLPAGSPRCESCQRFGHCSACSEAKGCELGTCAKGYSETTFNGVTTSCVFKTRCHATEFPNSGGDPGACLWDWARALMGCTQAQCTLGTGCTSCPKNKVVVRTCPRLQSCIGEKTLGCAPRATKANVGCESCPARSVRMPLMSSARTSWACVSCKKLGCPAGKCQDGVGCTACAEGGYPYRTPRELVEGKSPAQVLPWACGDCAKDLKCAECKKSVGCTACPADYFLAVSTSKCFGRGLWARGDPTYGYGCGPGDGITVCKPCAARGCAPGACSAKGVCSKCAPGWLPKPATEYNAPGGCIKLTDLGCDDPSTFSAAKPGCVACPNSSFPPRPPSEWAGRYWSCWKDGDE